MGTSGSAPQVATPNPATSAPATPPIAPDHVLFGLIAGQSLRPPTARPTMYPMMSVIHTIANRNTIARNP
jgi:hypothetical protein